MSAMNEVYRKENNIAGLEEINKVLIIRCRDRKNYEPQVLGGAILTKEKSRRIIRRLKE